MIPRLRLFAGPNGAGKTTLTHTLRDEFSLRLGFYVNPDDIAANLIDHFTDETSRFRTAQAEARNLRENLLLQRDGLTYESVMSHPSHLDFVKKANASGYRSYLYYIGIAAPEICIDRVAGRVEDGGHDVPTEKIMSRYTRSLSHLPAMCQLMYRVFLFDNTGDQHVFVGEINSSGILHLYKKEIASVGGAPWMRSLIDRWAKDKVKMCAHAP